jgi:hypothetical protein
MVGAWWAAARAAPPRVPLVASEHNQMSWPDGDHTPQAREAARRVEVFFAHRPAVRAWAAGSAWTTVGCTTGGRWWKACRPGHCRDCPRRG